MLQTYILNTSVTRSWCQNKRKQNLILSTHTCQHKASPQTSLVMRYKGFISFTYMALSWCNFVCCNNTDSEMQTAREHETPWLKNICNNRYLKIDTANYYYFLFSHKVRKEVELSCFIHANHCNYWVKCDVLFFTVFQGTYWIQHSLRFRTGWTPCSFVLFLK